MVVHRRERHFREHQLGTGLFKIRRSTRPVPIVRKAQGMTGNEMSFRRKLTTAYHLVDERNWASVERNGLMSANRLAVASGYDLSTLRLHRPKGLVLPSGIRIRDQSPMPPAVLAKCLHGGLCPEDWYDLLNSKVFFWLEPERLDRQRKACGDGAAKGAGRRCRWHVGKPRQAGGGHTHQHGQCDAGRCSARTLNLRSLGSMVGHRMGIRRSREGRRTIPQTIDLWSLRSRMRSKTSWTTSWR